MTLNLQVVAPTDHTLSLAADEHAGVAALAEKLAATAPGLVDEPVWLAAAARASGRLPFALRDRLRVFRRDSGTSGVLLLRGLPLAVDDLPATPSVLNSVQRDSSAPASVLAMISLQLGELVAFRPEKWGALVQDVVPVPGKEDFQGNAGSALLRMHVENAFHPNRPDHVALICLRNDHENIAGLRTASIRDALPLLAEGTLQVLNERRFVTEAPASFGVSADSAVPHAVLEGVVEDPDVRIDFTSTFPLDQDAAAAMVELQEALAQVELTTILEPGDLAIVDNRIALHGRTAFRPRYDGRDRWLQRTFTHVDLRRSRPVRPHDHHVID